MSLQGAIDNLQAKAKALTTVNIKAAPVGPQDSVPPIPAALTYLASGSVSFVSGTQTRFDCILTTNLYFPRSPLDAAYGMCNLAVIEFLKKVALDPQLGNNTTNVINPTFEVLDREEWNGQEVVVLSIHSPAKIIEVPA